MKGTISAIDITMKLNNDIFYNYGYVLYNLYSSYDNNRMPSIIEKELKRYIGEAKYGYFREDNEFNNMYLNLIARYKNESTFPVSMLWHIKDHASREELTFCISSIENFHRLCKQYLPNNEKVNFLVPRILLNLR